MSYPGGPYQHSPGQQPYGQPQQGQPAYGQPQYGQPQYGQPQYGQPQYGQPVYGAPSGWSPGPAEPQKSANPVGGILLLIGGAAGLLSGVLPWQSLGGGVSINGLDAFSALIDSGGGTESTLFGIEILVVFIGGIICALIALTMFFPASGHRGLGAVALVVALLMVVGPIHFLAKAEGNFGSSTVGYWLYLGAGLICLIGALVGVAKK